MKNYLIFVFLILGSLRMTAQFGIRAGLNASTLKYSDRIEGVKNIMGYHAGLFYDFEHSSKIATRFSGNFIRKGVQWKTFLGTYTKGKFNNVEIGTDFLYTLFSKGNKKINIYAGPQLGYVLKLTYDYGAGSREVIEFDEDDEISRFDYGLNGGITFSISSAFVGLNYNLGLSNVDYSDMDNYKVSHRVLSFTVGNIF